ncbi:VaFE repeat-containing surface-anchored protein [Actinotignum sp. GS-2025b]|uniref:VaFE repeat-containing surface-anchored protein n=1 Tax=Actinotignum sp. GS-2025b TaxID=3427275 RepID=UPI003F48BE16
MKGLVSTMAITTGPKSTPHVIRVFLAFLMVFALAGAGLFGGAGARADWDHSVGRGIEIKGVNIVGHLRLGPHYAETQSINGVAVEGYPIWCIQAKYADPGPGEMVDITTLTESRALGPGELQLSTPQMAWLLNRYEGNTTDDLNLAALSYLIHVNFEKEYPGRPGRAQETVNELVQAVRTQRPDIEERAQSYVREARASAAVGYVSGIVEGEGERSGAIRGIGVHPDDSEAWLPGIPVVITLTGPAVFDASGSTTWSGVTDSKSLELAWSATGNGQVSYTAVFDTPVRTTLTIFGADGTVQDTITYGHRPVSDPLTRKVPGRTWEVIYDFQPLGTSKVSTRPINTDGVIRDTLTTAVKEDYGDGKWSQVKGENVPVTYRATAYWAGRTSPQRSDIVPEGAEVLGSVTVQANGPGQTLTAELSTPKRGFVTWVWEVRKNEQGENSRYIHADWADHYGLPEETSREEFPFRPLGVSHVADAKVVDTGTVLSDTFVARADENFRDGEWSRRPGTNGSFEDGPFIPVTYRATAWYVSPTAVPEPGVVPASSEKIGSVTVVAEGPGPIRAELSEPVSKPGMYTWVWEVLAEDQPAEFLPWIEAGWSDTFGLADETTSVRYPGKIDSALSIRQTKSGTYLVDDVWVSGLPANHPDFTGGAGFGADTQTLTHTLLFFPEGQAVTDENRAAARQIGQPVVLPARNGFYPSVGDPSWIMEQDEAGENLPGTYVVVSDFAGDDRAAPLATSVTDVTEQFTVTREPSLHTTMHHEDTHIAPNTGTVTLVDTVSYQHLIPGKEYEVHGALLDPASGQPLRDTSGSELTSTSRFVPEHPNGSVEVVFEVDAATLAGTKVVATETLRQDGRDIAVHADLKDTNQTVTFTRLATRARDGAPSAADHASGKDGSAGIDGTEGTNGAGGDQILSATADAVITDEVCELSGALIPGETYRIETAAMFPDGTPVLGKDGTPVRKVSDFVPGSPSECARIKLDFDASALAGREVVLFEWVYLGDRLISEHTDPLDSEQTVRFEEPPVPPTTPPATPPATPPTTPPATPPATPPVTPPAPPELQRTGAALAGWLLAGLTALAGGLTLRYRANSRSSATR